MAPARSIPTIVGMHVFGAVITSSPGSTPAASSAIVIASVPDATPTACEAAQAVANADSKRSTSSERM